MSDIILHHYALSPYSQKLRSLLGYKRFAWRSASVPMVPPRPELSAMTGGFRRIPILQAGADLICDSNLAVRVIEELLPQPALAPSPFDHAVSRLWEPRQMIYLGPIRFRNRSDVATGFSSEAELIAFRADRAPFMAPATDISKGVEFAPSALAHVRHQATWLEDTLDGRDYLGGAAPSHADFSGFHGFWWLKPASAKPDLFSDFPRLWAWVDRMEALQAGAEGSPISQTEAFAAAGNAQPSLQLPNAPLPTDPKPGARVSIVSDDYGKDPVIGDLVSISPDHVSLRRETAEAGTLHLHFPRWGYRVIAA
jgi:glutathione S-transferase